MEQAKESLIQRQDTHLDSLAERLREPRVRRIIEPMLAGTVLPDVPEDDRQFVVDLGLVRRTGGGLVIANPIYREVIPRVLAAGAPPRCRNPADLAHATTAGSTSTGCWRPSWPSGASTAKRCWRAAPYPEIAPQLVMMAFLRPRGQRRRDAGAGVRHRAAGGMDLCLRYGPDTLRLRAEGLARRRGRTRWPRAWRSSTPTWRGSALATGWLVIFDQRERPAADRGADQRERGGDAGGRRVTAIRG